MDFFSKYRIAVLMVLMAGTTWLPLSPAQTITIPNIMQWDSSGAYLGIQMEDVTAANMSKYKLTSERGVIVREVMKGSPAESANIRVDDVILEFGGYPVWSSQQMSRLVQETPVGRKVELGIGRDGQRMNLSVQLAARDRGRADNRMVTPAPRIYGAPDGRFFEFRVPNPAEQNPFESDARKARLGLTLQPLTDQLGEFLGVPNKKGALVASVAAGSPSDGKLKSGDVIIAADGSNIDSPESLAQFIRKKTEGSITLKIIRNKRETTVVVNLPGEDNQKGYKL